ncbi:Uncharacterised protein [[Haemophilus] ducreyi]|nr:Uncharacterised protein [[Haemophilus] ducreyi]
MIRECMLHIKKLNLLSCAFLLNNKYLINYFVNILLF